MHYLDRAAARYEIGQKAEAIKDWNRVAKEKPEGVAGLLAKCRLKTIGEAGKSCQTELSEMILRLEGDPAGGELLRRVRWELNRSSVTP